jgi:hypothetical protein
MNLGLLTQNTAQKIKDTKTKLSICFEKTIFSLFSRMVLGIMQHRLYL